MTSWYRWLCLAVVAFAPGTMQAQAADQPAATSVQSADTTPGRLWTRAPNEQVPRFAGRVRLLGQRNVTSIPGAMRTLAPGLIGQLSNTPDVWGRTTDGLGRRIGRTFISNAGRDLVLAASTAAFGQDPRYEPCFCNGIARRTGHALSGLVMFAVGNGQRRIGPGVLASSLAGGVINSQLYEPTGASRNNAMQRAGVLLASTALTHVAFEFRSEIRKAVGGLLRRGKEPAPE